MRYVLLINTDEAAEERLAPDAMGKMMAGYFAFHDELVKAGAFRDGIRLRPTTTATTVRVRNGTALTTDGPFAETKEQFGGLYVIDVADLDEAIRWAAKIPGAQNGCVEVRPVWEMNK